MLESKVNNKEKLDRVTAKAEEKVKAPKFMNKKEILASMNLDEKEGDEPIQLVVSREYFEDRDFDRAFYDASMNLRKAGYNSTPIDNRKNKSLDFFFALEKDEMITIIDPKRGAVQVKRSQLGNTIPLA